MTVYTFKNSLEEIEQEQETQEKRKEESIKAAVTFIAFFVKPAIVMLLWNWLLPGIFGLATIGYFKALGLYLLTRLFIDKE